VSASSNAPSAGGGFPGGRGGFPGGGGGAGRVHFGGLRGVTNTLTQLQTSAGWSTVIFAFLIALLVATLGSSLAVATIVRIRPAEVLRSE